MEKAREGIDKIKKKIFEVEKNGMSNFYFIVMINWSN